MLYCRQGRDPDPTPVSEKQRIIGESYLGDDTIHSVDKKGAELQ